ncbi:hypothetical protein ACFX13_024673 [Malus domestica]
MAYRFWFTLILQCQQRQILVGANGCGGGHFFPTFRQGFDVNLVRIEYRVGGNRRWLSKELEKREREVMEL